MNDYIKIMNDEDDEPLFGKRSSRHKKKDRKKNRSIAPENDSIEYDYEPEVPHYAEAYTASVPDEETVIIPKETSTDEDTSDNVSTSYNYDYDYQEDETSSRKSTGKFSKRFAKKADKKTKESIGEEDNLPEEDDVSTAEPEPDETLETAFERIEEEDNTDNIKVRSSAGRIVLRTILSILFVICFVATAAVASMNLVLNINTGKKALGNYYFFTATYDYEDAGINSGDFVICKSSTYLIDGSKAVFIYTDEEDSQKKVAFGVKNGGNTDDDGQVIYLIGNQQISREDALGTIEKTLPKAGKIIDIVFSNYLIFIIILAALTIILFILITLVLRNKEKAAIKEQKKAEKKLSSSKKSKKKSIEFEEEIETQNNDMETSDDFDNVGTYDNLFNDID